MDQAVDALRMRELVARSGVPRTKIHFYLREGLLPPPTKTAPNAALYGEAHLRRLALLQEMREPQDGGPALPLPQVRRVLEWVERGVEPEVAVLLQRAVAGDVEGVDEGPFDAPDLARAAGVAPELLARLIEAGVLLPPPDAGPSPFDGLDLRLLQTIAALFAEHDVPVDALAPIATHLREASRLEMQLRDRVVGGLPVDGAAAATLALQRAGNLFHRYLFYRARQHDIHALRQRERAAGQERDRP